MPHLLPFLLLLTLQIPPTKSKTCTLQTSPLTRRQTNNTITFPLSLTLCHVPPSQNITLTHPPFYIIRTIRHLKSPLSPTCIQHILRLRLTGPPGPLNLTISRPHFCTSDLHIHLVGIAALHPTKRTLLTTSTAPALPLPRTKPIHKIPILLSLPHATSPPPPFSIPTLLQTALNPPSTRISLALTSTPTTAHLHLTISPDPTDRPHNATFHTITLLAPASRLTASFRILLPAQNPTVHAILPPSSATSIYPTDGSVPLVLNVSRAGGIRRVELVLSGMTQPLFATEISYVVTKAPFYNATFLLPALPDVATNDSVGWRLLVSMTREGRPVVARFDKGVMDVLRFGIRPRLEDVVPRQIGFEGVGEIVVSLHGKFPEDARVLVDGKEVADRGRELESGEVMRVRLLREFVPVGERRVTVSVMGRDGLVSEGVAVGFVEGERVVVEVVDGGRDAKTGVEFLAGGCGEGGRGPVVRMVGGGELVFRTEEMAVREWRKFGEGGGVVFGRLPDGIFGVREEGVVTVLGRDANGTGAVAHVERRVRKGRIAVRTMERYDGRGNVVVEAVIVSTLTGCEDAFIETMWAVNGSQVLHGRDGVWVAGLAGARIILEHIVNATFVVFARVVDQGHVVGNGEIRGVIRPIIPVMNDIVPNVTLAAYIPPNATTETPLWAAAHVSLPRPYTFFFTLRNLTNLPTTHQSTCLSTCLGAPLIRIFAPYPGRFRLVLHVYNATHPTPISTVHHPTTITISPATPAPLPIALRRFPAHINEPRFHDSLPRLQNPSTPVPNATLFRSIFLLRATASYPSIPPPRARHILHLCENLLHVDPIRRNITLVIALSQTVERVVLDLSPRVQTSLNLTLALASFHGLLADVMQTAPIGPRRDASDLASRTLFRALAAAQPCGVTRRVLVPRKQVTNMGGGPVFDDYRVAVSCYRGQVSSLEPEPALLQMCRVGEERRDERTILAVVERREGLSVGLEGIVVGPTVYARWLVWREDSRRGLRLVDFENGGVECFRSAVSVFAADEESRRNVIRNQGRVQCRNAGRAIRTERLSVAGGNITEQKTHVVSDFSFHPDGRVTALVPVTLPSSVRMEVNTTLLKLCFEDTNLQGKRHSVAVVVGGVLAGLVVVAALSAGCAMLSAPCFSRLESFSVPPSAAPRNSFATSMGMTRSTVDSSTLNSEPNSIMNAWEAEYASLSADITTDADSMSIAARTGGLEESSWFSRDDFATSSIAHTVTDASVRSFGVLSTSMPTHRAYSSTSSSSLGYYVPDIYGRAPPPPQRS